MPRILSGGRRDAKLGTTPSGKAVWLEKHPTEYKGWSPSDHLYAAVLHEANRTRGGEIARLHRALAQRAATLTSHARMIESRATGREVFAAHERDHHITTAGRLALSADQFALPPSPEERRRGIKGRLPIDTLKRARNALARAAQMKKRGHISAGQLAAAQRKVHRAWPSIESE